MKARLLSTACICLFSLASMTAQAAAVSGQGTWETTLEPRDLTGDGVPDAYYDTVLDITWLADANLAASNTFGTGGIFKGAYGAAGGYMLWDTANAWIANMNAANYLGFNDWRLPTMIDTGDPGCDYAKSGGTDCGYNVLTGSAGTTVYSELASMFYDTLGNLAPYDTSGAPRQSWGLSNTGPFSNVVGYFYWFGTEYAPDPIYAWQFSMGEGYQYIADKGLGFYVWPVRSGDVISAVPIPAAAWLFGSGLIGLLGVASRKRG